MIFVGIAVAFFVCLLVALFFMTGTDSTLQGCVAVFGFIFVVACIPVSFMFLLSSGLLFG